MLDVEGNTAVVSKSECDKNDGNLLLCCYRCQVNTNRVDLKFRTVEGQHGTLRVYVTPNIQPKCCQLKTYAIHPLSLHMAVHNYDETRLINIGSKKTNFNFHSLSQLTLIHLSRPMSKLSLKGNFSQGEMHSWIRNCLPEVPERINSSEENILLFKNVFLETFLICKYSKGDAEFCSDNISTISIIKDFITKEATTKHIKIELSLGKIYK